MEKQHLKIKSFWGTTENAVKTQVYIVVFTHTLVAIIRHRLKTEHSTYEVLQILGSSLLHKTPINQLLKKPSDQDVKELLYNQLKIWHLNETQVLTFHYRLPKMFRQLLIVKL